MRPDNKDEKKERRKSARAMSEFAQVGVTMAACIIIGVFLGRFLDRVLGTSPWLLLVFSLLGVISAIKSIFDLAKNPDEK